ncbi:MAG TPA: tRNA (adenosine(37)-N6)-dimethylallyltransferase MiaA [Elusimicrobia bacterium]|nr:MAG: tRNA (adenosine(37)-N6)-dimethylallyltransferase MiaA [Elusimicrobia bacterium RIFOXYD2_FULL_34_30]HAM38398.1 tRNA (adenosine(37)-N6)-dimethylallyltransferase MiaA [Elusimicrobiota bacterium]
MKKIIIISGPTATGKTDVAIKLAKNINGEIISADSRQLYKKLNIGTNKPTKKQLSSVKHHLINIAYINSKQQFNAGDFVRLSNNKIENILNRKKIPVIVGGTGLYIKSLIDGLIDIKGNKKIRNSILNIFKKHGLDFLFRKLKKLDPETAKMIDKKNPVRVIRAVEICLLTGKKYSALKKITNKPKYDFLIFCLNMDRKQLYRNINKRVDMMINKGLINETKKIVNEFSYKNPILQSTIGYKEIIGYLTGTHTKETAIELLKQNTRKYAKRQLTWFKKDKRVIWIDACKNPLRKILNYIQKSDILYTSERHKKSTFNRC